MILEFQTFSPSIYVASPSFDDIVVSSGDVYIDFRVGITTTDKNKDVFSSNRYISYLIVWYWGTV